MPSPASSATQSSWFTKRSHILTPYLAERREINSFIKLYSPDVSAFDDSQDFKMLPDLSQVLHNEKNLMAREIDFLPGKLGLEYKINIFDMGIPNGLNIFPLVYKLFESDVMGTYVPVAPNVDRCRHANRKLEIFCKRANLPELEYDMILVDPNFTDFKTQVLDVIKSQEEHHTNLFMLPLPYLGVVANPGQYLRNIYESMPQGSYLVILQSLYRPGTEHALVADHLEMSQYMRVTKNVADMINPKGVITADWSDRDDNPAVHLYVNVDEPVNIAGVDLDSGEKVSVFRFSLFERIYFENLVREAGFKVRDMAFDDHMDNTIFFLSK
jgi:hypothetical protein